MKNDDSLYLYHIRDSIKLIKEYTSKVEKSEFLNNSMMQDAVIRQLEIIGEASNKVSENTKSKLNIIPWKDIIGMRNILIHQYFGVDIESVWSTIQNDIEPMLNAIITFIDK